MRLETMQAAQRRSTASTGRRGTLALVPEPASPAANEPGTHGSLAVLALRELALGALLADSPDAPRLWRAYVVGELRVIDRFERAGRRFVLGVDVAPAAPVAPLTGREAQALALAVRGRDDKYIAYELGLQPSTAASLLSRAARKLGAADRMALIRRGLADSHAPRGLRVGWLELAERRVVVLELPDAPGRPVACEDDACDPRSGAPATHPALAGLSAAERAVASLLLAGHRRAAIAELRGAALGTVHKQVECVYRKLGVGSRRELAAHVFAGERRSP